MTRVLDWRGLPVSSSPCPSCVLCGGPAACVSPQGKPCHKTCAEQWLNDRGGCFDCSGTGRTSIRGQLIASACLTCGGSGTEPPSRDHTQARAAAAEQLDQRPPTAQRPPAGHVTDLGDDADCDY